MLGLRKLVLEHINHVVFILNDLLLAFGFVKCFHIFSRLELRLFKFLLHILFLLFLRQNCGLKVILDLTDLVQLGFLNVKCFLQPVLVFNCTFLLDDRVVLLRVKGIILNHGLLKQRSKPHALVDINLNFGVILIMTTKADVALELINEPVLLLDLNLHASILLL